MTTFIRIFLAIIFCCSTSSAVDFNMDFQWKYEERNALNLLNKKKYKEAEEAFAKLLKTADRKKDKLNTLSNEALAVGYQKGRYEGGIEKAQKIEDSSIAAYTQMKLMYDNRNYNDVIEKFADEDISLWPENLKYEGYVKRGNCYIKRENHKEALEDLSACLNLEYNRRSARVLKKTSLYVKLAGLHEKLGEVEEAEASYKEAVRFFEEEARSIGNPHYCGVVLNYANFLEEKKELEKAAEILTRHEVWSPSGAPRVVEKSGDIYVLMGDKGKAIERYKKGIEFCKKTMQRYKKSQRNRKYARLQRHAQHMEEKIEELKQK